MLGPCHDVGFKLTKVKCDTLGPTKTQLSLAFFVASNGFFRKKTDLRRAGSLPVTSSATSLLPAAQEYRKVKRKTIQPLIYATRRTRVKWKIKTICPTRRWRTTSSSCVRESKMRTAPSSPPFPRSEYVGKERDMLFYREKNSLPPPKKIWTECSFKRNKRLSKECKAF